ncbi:MAG: hypothetical protein WCV81_05215 [Microgenomates group bacterium]|jgi:hypothetical protein
MKSEIQPTLFAVGALIVCGGEFAAVTEENTSRKSVKIAGQQTHPMETIEDFDKDDSATLCRACKEEVKLIINPENFVLLNSVETRPSVELRNYFVNISAKDLVGRGEFIDEVSPVEWLPLQEVISSKGSLRFRPGVFETVSDYMRLQSNPSNFKPGEYGHTDLVDQIPSEVYGLVDSGVNGKEAVFRWLHQRQP